jgi:serine/threonine protein kinase
VTEEDARENYIKIIEAQSSISGRFTKIYRIDPKGGSGTFSLVFRAFDGEKNQEVALKFYDPYKRGIDYRERCFKREAKILDSLKGQKDILQITLPLTQFPRKVIDAGTGISTIERWEFFATELADSNMMRYTYSNEPTPAKNLRYFRAMVRGVQRIHSRQICHRDIKPENFFRIGKEVIHLGDIGTARVLDGSMPALHEDYIYWRGDKKYTAPEQCVSIVDKPALFYVGDMYSLGAILFEMFTKQLLFPLIFDEGFHQSLAEHFALMPQERREKVLGELVPDIAKERELPNISDFNKNVPKCIKGRLERLYHGLAAIDYNKRTKDFGEIFQALSVCETILAKEKYYEEMLRLRKKWLENKLRKKK